MRLPNWMVFLPWALSALLLCASLVPAPPQCRGCQRNFDSGFTQETSTNDCKLNLRVIEDTSGCGGAGISVNGLCALFMMNCVQNATCKSRVLLEYSSCCDNNVIDWTCGAPPGSHECTVAATTGNCAGNPVWVEYIACPPDSPPPCFSGEVNCNDEAQLLCTATLENDDATQTPVREAVSLEFVTRCTSCEPD